MAGEQNASSRILDDIRRAGERARELVDQILTFSRRRHAQRSVVSIKDIDGRGNIPSSGFIADGDWIDCS